MDTKFEMAVALLHDVIEDSEITADDLLKEGLPSEVVEAVQILTKVGGNIGTNKKLNRFSFRGKEKVQTQWCLFCLIHNIEKLKDYGKLAA